jgi:hypothetical protein
MPYTWTLTSGTLPSGLFLASTGAITGTPTKAMSASLIFKVTDSGSPAQSQSTTLALNIVASPAITSANNATFAVDTAGSFTVTATGSPTPTLTESGALPSGVTFVGNGDGTATMSGTPAAGTDGSYPLTLTASNGIGAAATQSFTLEVNRSGGGGTATWGTMDVWLHCNTSSPGTVLTITILGACDQSGNLANWKLNPNPPTGFTIAASQGSMGGSITVGGTTYPVGTATQSMALDNSNNFTYVTSYNIPANTTKAVANGFITFGDNDLGTNGGNDSDLIIFTDYISSAEVLQLVNGNGCYCVRVEAGGKGTGGTRHSPNINVTPGYRYSFSIMFDEVNGVGSLAIFDPNTNFAQVGTTVSVDMNVTTGPTGNNPGLAGFRFGNGEVATSPGTTTYFEDLMLDWTNHIFPNFPH